MLDKKMDFRSGCWLIGGRPKKILIWGDHLFLNYIFFLGQFLLINREGIINPHLTLYIYIYVYVYLFKNKHVYCRCHIAGKSPRTKTHQHPCRPAGESQPFAQNSGDRSPERSIWNGDRWLSGVASDALAEAVHASAMPAWLIQCEAPQWCLLVYKPQ